MAEEVQMSAQEKIENRRSRVRVYVTYIAAGYVFFGSGLLIIIMLLGGDVLQQPAASAKEVFTLVLPVATGIITYWFASRRPSDTSADEPEQQLANEPSDNENPAGSPQD